MLCTFSRHSLFPIQSIPTPSRCVLMHCHLFEIQHISSPVHTVCVGHAESMAAILLSAGEPGQRRAMPHSRVMVHQPSLGVNRATAADVMIQVGMG